MEIKSNYCKNKVLSINKRRCHAELVEASHYLSSNILRQAQDDILQDFLNSRLHSLFRIYLFFLLIVIFFSSCSQKEDLSYVNKVNPFIGTDGHGHTYPGATVPFGMVQLSPDTRLEGWDGCSGYHYSDTIIYGFSHTHLSGTGVADYCDILFMPARNHSKEENGYMVSTFNHQNEKAQPGYYQVFLDDHSVNVELTTTERAGFHRYTYDGNCIANVSVNLEHRDEVLASGFQIINDTTIAGFRRSKSWAEDQFVFFYAIFSQPIETNKIFSENKLTDSLSVNSKNIRSNLYFTLQESCELLVKIGISAVDIKGAKQNLLTEIPHWDFELTKKNAQEKWDKSLSKIEVKGGTEAQQSTFYSALYHTMLSPNIFHDVDGRYRGTDIEIHQSNDFTNYTVFSLWDTYRAAHPLYTIIEQERTKDFVKTFFHQFKNGGKLPMWELAGNYTGCMIGYHAVPVIVDAYLKGIVTENIDSLYQAVKHSAMLDVLGIDAYKKYGFIPGNLEHESVSKTLEYAYDDWCIAQLAYNLNEENDFKYFTERAQSYKNLFHPKKKFIRAKIDGAWYNPFDPKEVNYNYTEANGWQYHFYVPHDIETFIQLHGGGDEFDKKLDLLFTTDSKTTGRNQADITGQIGQYAHGNEPSHHIAYLYNYIGKPHKSAKLVREIMNDLYSDKPDGLCGNEDCGQMSAWYIFSAMGFYPVNPADGNYIFGSPIFDQIIINLENGNKTIIKVKNNSPDNIYIQSVKVDNENYLNSYLTHEMITNGSRIDIQMGENPNEIFGKKEENIPKSIVYEYPILEVPYFHNEKKVFKGSQQIILGHINKDASIYYTIDGSKPNENSLIYSKKIRIDKNTNIKAFAKLGDKISKIVETNYTIIPEKYKIEIKNKYANQYAANGDFTILDGIKGTDDYRTGTWQGYEGVDFEAIIDLGIQKYATTFELGFFQDINSWIFMPEYVEFEFSNDGKYFTKLGKINNKVSHEEWGTITDNFKISFYPKNIRFIKIKAKNIGICPDWHKGAGGKAWIFVDELTIK
jgi:predicted alpha-1,2-mannosidase